MVKQRDKFILLILMIMFFLGCSNKFLVIPSYPNEAPKKSDFSKIELFITKFDVENLSDSDDPKKVRLLEEMLIEYVKSRNIFKEIHGSFGGGGSAKGSYLTMEVEIIPNAISRTNAFLNVVTFYPFFGLWPITPINVTAEVITIVSVHDSEGTLVNTFKAEGLTVKTSNYYGLYKRESLTEEALKNSYKKSFDLVGEYIGGAHRILLDAAAPGESEKMGIFEGEPPQLTYTCSLVDENGDNVLEGGESVELRVKIVNEGNGIAKSVRVKLGGESQLTQYLGEDKPIGEILPGNAKILTLKKVLPYHIKKEDASIIIKVTEGRGFHALKQTELLVAMIPAKVQKEVKVLSRSVDVDNIPGKLLPDQNAVGIIIGISKYQEPTIPEITYAKRDAEVITKYFENVVGIPIQNIFTLYDEEATKSPIIELFSERLPYKVDKNTKVFVYFAGHGSPDEEGKVYIVPYNGRIGSKVRMLSLEEIYSYLHQLPTKEVVVFLDACFTGEGRSVLAMGKRPLVPVKITRPKFAVLAASREDQTSNDFEEKRHGLFTYYLLKALGGEADKNSNGWVELGECYEYVKNNVYKTARENLYTEQEPTLLPQGILAEKSMLRISKAK
jgi:hypothetical protein